MTKKIDYLLIDPFASHKSGVTAYTKNAKAILEEYFSVEVLSINPQENIEEFRKRVAHFVRNNKVNIVEAPETRAASKYIDHPRLNTRVSKNSLRPHAMGDVDELNSHIGLLLCEDLPTDVRELLIDIQHQLFNLGGEISIPGFELLKDDALAQLDAALERYNAALPRLQEFILPAGTPH